MQASEMSRKKPVASMLSRSVMSNSLQPHGLQPARLLCSWDSPGKNTGVHSHFLLQEIFPAQGSNPGLPYFRQILYHLSPPGKPMLIKQCTIYEHSLSFLCYLEMSQVKLWSSKCSPCSPGHARMSKTRNGHLALW